MYASSQATKRVPSETPCAPSSSARASPRPSPIPPEASTGTGPTASTAAGSSSQIEVVPLTWPPASIPCAITASTPAAAAARASGSEPTCTKTLTPWRCASFTNGAGGPQNSTSSGTRASIDAAIPSPTKARSSSEECGSSKSAMMTLTPNGRSVRSRTAAMRRRSSSAGTPLPPSTPQPPAPETAATSSGPAEIPKPTEKIGYLMPSAWQSGVCRPATGDRSMGESASLRAAVAGEPDRVAGVVLANAELEVLGDVALRDAPAGDRHDQGLMVRALEEPDPVAARLPALGRRAGERPVQLQPVGEGAAGDVEPDLGRGRGRGAAVEVAVAAGQLRRPAARDGAVAGDGE